MRTAVVQHSLAEDFQLVVEDVPAPMQLIEDHWPVWPNRIPGVEYLWFLLTQKVFRWTDKYRKQVVKFPITREQADVLNPDAWWWLDDEEGD